MDDFHPHKVFRFQTLYPAYVKKDWGALLFFLPGTIIKTILRSKLIGGKEWLELSVFGLCVIVNFYTCIIVGQHKRSKYRYSSFFTAELCINTANYFKSVICIFNDILDGFAMGSIGSIVNEHFFGRIRDQATDDTFKSIFYAIKRILILDKYSPKPFNKVIKRWFKTAFINEGSISHSEESYLNIWNKTLILF